MKESYEALSMEIVAFEAEDVIESSIPGDGEQDGIGGSYWFRG